MIAEIDSRMIVEKNINAITGRHPSLILFEGFLHVL